MIRGNYLDVVTGGCIDNRGDIVTLLGRAAIAAKVFVRPYTGATFTNEGHFTFTGGTKAGGSLTSNPTL